MGRSNGGGVAVSFLTAAARKRTVGELPPAATTRDRKPLVLPDEVRKAFDMLDAGEYVQVGTTTSQGSAVGASGSWTRAADAAGLGKTFIVAIRKDPDSDVIALWVGNDAEAVKQRAARLEEGRKRRRAKKDDDSK